ncbi:MAG: hypothetical protein U9R79_09180, partial [Armatimonadota bacterium]|nr:hypothetical protein [Armatimonadota bacterium]
VTGDGVPEILSRYSRRGHEGRGELGVLILDNRGHRLARIPGVTAGSAGPYVFRPDGPGAGPVYLLATTNVYEIVAEPSSPE